MCKELQQQCHQSYIKKIENNTRSCWKYVNDKKKSDILLSTMYLEYIICNRNDGIVRLTAKHFSTTYTDVYVIHIPQYKSTDNLHISNYYVEITQVITQLMAAPGKF